MEDGSLPLRGIALAPGVALARAVVWRRIPFEEAKGEGQGPDRERGRLAQARNEAREELAALRRHAAQTVGEERAAVFDAHVLMLDDPLFVGGMEEEIARGLSAPDAVVRKTAEIRQLFEGLPDPYLRERGADVEDVGRRLFRHLLGVPSLELSAVADPPVLVAEELSPSETAGLSANSVAALVTERGGATGHTAILAKSLGIPAVGGIEGLLDSVAPGDWVGVDGDRGEVVLRPSPSELILWEKRRELNRQELQVLRGLRDLPAISADGVSVELWGNISRPEETEEVVAQGGTGVGLFRTEFLYMQSSDLPSEEHQFEAYQRAVRGMGGRPTVIRTLDAGGDKEVPCLASLLPREENPFMGYRALRICLEHEEIFLPQLRALLRAGAFGDLRIMFPMVAGPDDLGRARDALERARKSLERDGVPFGPVKVGAMIEIPSAALQARELASLVDFFSVGTNDLTQYALAADRMNPRVAPWYDPFSPGVFRLLEMTAEAARERGIELGMCGEMAGDLRALPRLLALGFTELSMTPAQIPRVKRALRGLRLRG
ncbi:MAG TPA: phosphoenolpyruvate--protein phosphotransferase [Synergistaceae bacterium]|nr:phosphoenolpyruvate--protein phosphotransferase [Synergistaceae bacterium]